MRIVVVRLSSLGDVVLASAALSYLRQAHPHASVWMATARPYAELFAADSRVDRVAPIDHDLRESCISELAAQRWDWAIDLQGSRRSRALLSSVARQARVTTFAKLHARRALLLLGRISTYQRRDHVVARYLRAAGWQGAWPPPIAPSVMIGPSAQAQANAWLDSRVDVSRPLAALMPFAAWKNKQWPLDHYAQVAAALIRRGWSVLVLGGPEDGRACDAFAAAAGVHCVSAAGRMPLENLAAALTRCAVAVGNDTGLSHLARACGVRTAVIYGSTTWHWGFFPYGHPPFRVIEVPMLCRPCHAHGGNICWRGNRPCLSRIDAGRVVEHVLELSAADA